MLCPPSSLPAAAATPTFCRQHLTQTPFILQNKDLEVLEWDVVLFTTDNPTELALGKVVQLVRSAAFCTFFLLLRPRPRTAPLPS